MINSFNDREVATITAGLLALLLAEEQQSWPFRRHLAELYPDKFEKAEPLDREQITKLINELNRDITPDRKGA